jgi:alpha-D-ribose 1-methylphosphonate 5-triphosphate diphosphatase
MDMAVSTEPQAAHAESVLTNARIVTGDEIFCGSLLLRDGHIADIDTQSSALSSAIDLEGDLLLPGLVELHTDNLERHFSPRPGVTWPALRAVIAHDAEIAASGITTVLDAVRLGYVRGESEIVRRVGQLVEAIDQTNSRGMLRVDHQLHFRCEISTPDVVESLEGFLGHPLARLVSVMDHTPGQRQFADIEKYREYYLGKYGFSEAELQEFMTEARAAQARYSEPNRRGIVDLCHALGVSLASHDDATKAHVGEAVRDGMVIAEFPTTVEAAEESRRHGLKVLMGAPNLVRGKSHSGNVSALELGHAGLLDILSSDYVPASLLHAAFELADKVEAIDLPQAISTVTSGPARAVGLVDRGEIAIGQRADLIQVRQHDGAELVRRVWCEGERIV